MTHRFPLHVHISTLFIALILLVGGVIGGLGYRISSEILETMASELNARIGRETVGEFSNIIGPAEMAARLLSYDGITQATSLEQRLQNVGFMREALNNSSALTSLYVGYGNGDFFMVRRIWDEADGRTFDAPAQTAFMVQSIVHKNGESRGRYIFLDAGLKELRSDNPPDSATAFDPRTRGWYKAAMAAEGQIKTAPYVFYTTQKVGTTIANRANKADAERNVHGNFDERACTMFTAVPGRSVRGRTLRRDSPEALDFGAERTVDVDQRAKFARQIVVSAAELAGA